jgi:toxin ParE1/3/4
MPDYKIELLSTAWRELDEIADIHLSLVGVKSAEKITNEILDAINNLKNNPYMGCVVDEPMLFNDGYRKLICGKYLCFYKVLGHIVYIYHIADGRRNYSKMFE